MYAVYVKSDAMFVSVVDYDSVSFSDDEDEAIKFSSAELAACFIDCLNDLFTGVFYFSIYKF